MVSETRASSSCDHVMPKCRVHTLLEGRLYGGTCVVRGTGYIITYTVIYNWLDRVGSVIHRGFSRHYVLTSIKEAPMSGKEIIDMAN